MSPNRAKCRCAVLLIYYVRCNTSKYVDISSKRGIVMHGQRNKDIFPAVYHFFQKVTFAFRTSISHNAIVYLVHVILSLKNGTNEMQINNHDSNHFEPAHQSPLGCSRCHSVLPPCGR